MTKRPSKKQIGRAFLNLIGDVGFMDSDVGIKAFDV